MKLNTQPIRMTYDGCRQQVQRSLEEDINVPDVKPDVSQIMKEEGSVRIDEIYPVEDRYVVKGVMVYKILYLSEDEKRPVQSILGEIPFEESINLNFEAKEDVMRVRGRLDHLSASLINSRKIGLKGTMTLVLFGECILEKEVLSGGDESGNIYFKNKTIRVSDAIVSKHDMVRVKESLYLPGNKPGVEAIVYDETRLKNLNVRQENDKIQLSGDLSVFVMYMGDGDESRVQTFEMDVPFYTMLMCDNCREDMIGDIQVNLQKVDILVKPDEDGEERILEIEATLDLEIHLYQEEELTILNDVYSTTKELEITSEEVEFVNLKFRNITKVRVNDRILFEDGRRDILQICHGTAQVQIDEMEMNDEGIRVKGRLLCEALYITSEDRRPLGVLRGSIPFVQTIMVPNMTQDITYEVRPELEQMALTLIEGGDVEVRATISLDCIVFEKIREKMIESVVEGASLMEELEKKPGVVGYRVQEGDTLWSIAKEFYTTVESIRELNRLEREELKEGERLLLLKHINAL
ncbi:MAG: DUF3794 domain-containing protein [Lachnospiraceae bacterium]|nr:DUF3794 domain-containing protein [Lachnospiraceae bacterium]